MRADASRPGHHPTIVNVPSEPQDLTVHHGAHVPAAPRFSIVIPCYNLGELVHDSIQSALNQSVRDVEVIVVDDGSEPPVIDALQSVQERIVVLRQTNGGLSSARNTGIRAARGDFIVLLDGDDALLPTHCAACLQLFDTDSACLAAAPDAWIFGEGQPPGLKLSDLYSRRSPVDLEGFLSGRSLVPAWCTFRREVFSGLSEPYDVNFRRAEDFLFNSQLLMRGVKFCFLAEPTYRYRKRAGSLSFDNPVPLTRAVIQAIEKLESEHAADQQTMRMLANAKERYFTELNFHLFREAVLAKAYREAVEHARAVRVEFLQPARRRWKFYAGRAVATALRLVAPSR